MGEDRQRAAFCAQYHLRGIEPLPEPDACEIFFDADYAPGGYAWIYPTGHNSAKVGLGITDAGCRSPHKYPDALGMTWRFIDAGRIDGYYSAALFESIAKHVGAGRADETILFWRVKTPVVYLGYHQYVEDAIHEDYCVTNDIQVIRRVLGGGCGFCDGNQILFSVIGREAGGVERVF
ncbi:MAG: hypothetical protein U9N12_05730 [Euryarchaeota archaeon]|nr:hypothetical protein [Euryarchaeota archaeon]